MNELIFLALAPFIALLLEGVHRKFAARLQNRVGPPLLQPYYDLKKLWNKEKMESHNDVFFNIAPLLYFITNYALFIIIPLSIVPFEFDFMLLVYLTILAASFYTLAGVSSDSPFSIVGAMREMFLMIVYETTLALIIFSFMILGGTMTISGFSLDYAALRLPVATLCLFAVAIVELKITPFDTAEAETEVLYGTETEYYGKKLFFMEWSSYMKRLFYALLIPLFAIGLNNPLVYAAGCLATLLLLSLYETVTPRYGVEHSYVIIGVIMALAFVEFIRVMWGIA